VEHAAALPAAERAELLAYAGNGANYANRFEDALSWYQQSISCSQEAALQPVPFVLANLGIAALETNQPDAAAQHCAAAVDAARAADDVFWELFTMSNLVLACGLGIDHDRAISTSDEALPRSRRLGNQWILGGILMSAGCIRSLTEPELAIELLDESRRVLPTSSNVGQVHFWRGLALLRLGRPVEAAASMRDSLPHMIETGSDFFTATVVGTGAALIARSAPATAAELLGAVERFRLESGMEGAPADVETHARTRARLERAMDPEDLAAAWARGAGFTIEEAADVARAALGALVDG
jgi:tetratricopeptide (TPR) repeat protein